MSTSGTGPQGVPSSGQVPPPFEPAIYGPSGDRPVPRRWGAVIVGFVVGLVVGAGGLGLVWALGSGGSGDTGVDIEAVCGLVDRTDPLTKEFALGDMRRLGGVAELAAALAEDAPVYQPLARALEDSVRAAQAFDLPRSAAALRQAKDTCPG